MRVSRLEVRPERLAGIVLPPAPESLMEVLRGLSSPALGIEPRGRNALMKATQELATYVGVKPACAALRVPRATFYRRRSPTTGHQQPRPIPAPGLE